MKMEPESHNNTLSSSKLAYERVRIFYFSSLELDIKDYMIFSNVIRVLVNISRSFP